MQIFKIVKVFFQTFEAHFLKFKGKGGTANAKIFTAISPM
jgi:hypothetical protein